MALSGEQASLGIGGPVDVNAFTAFWEDIWGTEGKAVPQDDEIVEYGKAVAVALEDTEVDEIPWDAAWRLAVSKQVPWKAPGPDGLAPFWLRHLGGVANRIMRVIKEVLDSGDGLPHWFVRGQTVLIPKVEGATELGQFRPITCLNGGYKAMTGALTVILHRAVGTLLPEEQRAGVQGRRGCLDALVVDVMLAKEAKLYEQDLSVAWIDFRMAFDVVPHTCITACLEMVQAPEIVRRRLAKVMGKWATNLEIRCEGSGTIRHLVRFRRGLYQGDSLSPFLFSLVVSPLSGLLQKKVGFSSRFLYYPCDVHGRPQGIRVQAGRLGQHAGGCGAGSFSCGYNAGGEEVRSGLPKKG